MPQKWQICSGLTTLELINLDNGYHDGHNAVVLHSAVSFQAKRGELILVAGRNGSGKSTLLKCAAGLAKPVSGEIHISGRNIHKCSTEERASLISLMLANPPDLPMTTVEEAVMSNRQRFLSSFEMNLGPHLEVTHHCLKLTGMESFSLKMFSKLSDGEKQKIMLARCLAQETPVILLDEPLAFLDYPGRRDMLSMLRRLCEEENKIIIYSSHDLELAFQHCDHLVFLGKKGEWKIYSGAENIQKLKPTELFSD